MLVNLRDDEPEPGAMDMQYRCMAPSRVNSLNAMHCQTMAKSVLGNTVSWRKGGRTAL
jgi:hypothetical protein